MAAIELIREQVRFCESESVSILCCPEAILGGLADYASQPIDFAIDVERGQLAAVLAPLASNVVTSIVGFTEVAGKSSTTPWPSFKMARLLGYIFRFTRPSTIRCTNAASKPRSLRSAT